MIGRFRPGRAALGNGTFGNGAFNGTMGFRRTNRCAYRFGSPRLGSTGIRILRGATLADGAQHALALADFGKRIVLGGAIGFGTLLCSSVASVLGRPFPARFGVIGSGSGRSGLGDARHQPFDTGLEAFDRTVQRIQRRAFPMSARGRS
jgi:hypothetical protein